ncbi:MAG: acetyl-CoA carboxylase biotin carboxyl carrier protein subunit [Deltaproteobacteria bacterium]|nr:acetyl-CoA carboxylase biotin carboxyl carrier protein subunit [Deltaproteobacteria bacterium]
MKFRVAGYPGEFEVQVTEIGECLCAQINGREEILSVIESTSGGGAVVRIGRRAARLFSSPQRGAILVTAGPTQFEVIPVEARSARRVHGLVTPEIAAPMPGKVVKVPVREGQQVETGDVLVVLEAMKMETALHAESPAVVKRIQASVGQMVDHGTVLLVLSPAPSSLAGEADPEAR